MNHKLAIYKTLLKTDTKVPTLKLQNAYRHCSQTSYRKSISRHSYIRNHLTGNTFSLSRFSHLSKYSRIRFPLNLLYSLRMSSSAKIFLFVTFFWLNSIEDSPSGRERLVQFISKVTVQCQCRTILLITNTIKSVYAMQIGLTEVTFSLNFGGF